MGKREKQTDLETFAGRKGCLPPIFVAMIETYVSRKNENPLGVQEIRIEPVTFPV